MQPNGGPQGRMGLPPAGGSVSRRPTRLVLPRSLTLALALAAGAARAATPPLAVPLALEESAGVARHAWPASASVPLPRGRVQSPDKLWLAAPDGHAAPLQARALERWPDGSVRWLLLDFLADVPPGKVATYTLRDGAAPAPVSGARVRLEAGRDGARVLDTGALRVTVPARGEALLADLAAGPVRLAGAVPLPALAVDRARRGAPSHEGVTVETEGPVRTELLVTGRYPAGIAYEVRIAAFAGERFLRLQHTITDLADPHYAPLRSLLLTVPGHFTEAAVGIDGGRRTLGELARGHELRHTDATPALLDGVSAGRHADGWAEARGGGAAVTLVAPFFWQEYPKALRVGSDRLAIDLFAGKEAPVQFGHGRRQDARALARPRARGRRGVARRARRRTRRAADRHPARRLDRRQPRAPERARPRRARGARLPRAPGERLRRLSQACRDRAVGRRPARPLRRAHRGAPTRRPLRRPQLGRPAVPRLPRPRPRRRRVGEPRVRPAAGAGARVRRDREPPLPGRAGAGGAPLPRRRHHPPCPRPSGLGGTEPPPQGAPLRLRGAGEGGPGRPPLARRTVYSSVTTRPAATCITAPRAPAGGRSPPGDRARRSSRPW